MFGEEFVGCFVIPHSPSVKRAPQHPNVIKTRFLLYTRSERQTPEFIEYGDDLRSYKSSRFNASKNLKIIIHGFKGSGFDEGAIRGAQAMLDLEDTNVMLIDWARGANGSYGVAVANVELIGRQLSLILLDAMNLGTDPNRVHLIGFSLGAHIAGCASEVLKSRHILVGRITGLDPASPFFRHGIFRDRSRKLDASDAKLVDVVHTDGSIDFADGFGLLKPIGHVDFFPNGGREQAGCKDIKNAVVYTHLNEEGLDREVACSHLRAWSLFVESVQTQSRKCKFTAWPCPQGRMSFSEGTCFPTETDMWTQEMGYASDRGPLGIYFLLTRHEPPYCGDPYRVHVTTFDAPTTKGIMLLRIQQRNSTSTFEIPCKTPRKSNHPLIFYGLAATEFEAFSNSTSEIEAVVWYQANLDDEKQNKEEVSDDVNPSLFIQKIVLEDRRGNSWKFCKKNLEVDSTRQSVMLRQNECQDN